MSTDTSANIEIRKQLIEQLSDIVKSWEASQEKAAERLGVSQPRLSNIINKKYLDFSVDLLIKFLDKAGYKVNPIIVEK